MWTAVNKFYSYRQKKYSEICEQQSISFTVIDKKKIQWNMWTAVNKFYSYRQKKYSEICEQFFIIHENYIICFSSGHTSPHIYDWMTKSKLYQ